ncbi:pseudouridine synthase [Jannaschia seohaensis]|uniref:Pseudouridine synthase n=1 Tax=Jannaschia seohaensis TaxID=475081 RepID=A0A2Y9AGF4_9RHOB|nr:pseudouridine synthase [Jannaschia seohaensis]PWJ21017.1 23S rRNA pseudouridine2605 synthase [Jannaschia seohaensis]SSA41427.1 23S rRNA pseudouridine2605 synthase [Jannaschia seohaensis]
MTQDTSDGPRLAKAIARAGLASRRDAERMIAEGRVTINGQTVDSPARNVGPRDRVAVDGVPLPEAEGARLWLYHKPAGLVTTERDEKDRETVFDALRDRLGRVLSVGRLDLTSEGLLLLTNDGDLKRRLELPETGWLRRYRVRVNGVPDEAALQRLRDGIEIDGERFGEMQVTLDRQQGANAWLTVGLREGRNREVRRAAEAVGLVVNRLIRVSYGPFQLGKLAPGEVEEVKPRVLRDQLGAVWDGEFAEARRDAAPRHAGDRLMDKGRGKPGGKAPRGDAPRKGPGARADRAGSRPDKPRTGKPPVTRNDGKALGKGRRDDDRPRRDGDRPERKTKPYGDRPREDGRKGDGPRQNEGFKPRGDKPFGDRKRGDGPKGDRPRRDEGGKPRGDRPFENRKRGDGPKTDRSKRVAGAAPREGRPGQDRARSDAPETSAPRLTKTQRKAAMRADTSVSLRKGGQRGRGISKPKPMGGKPYTKPTKPKP